MGARFSLLFGVEGEPRDYRDVIGHDTALANRFYGHAMTQASTSTRAGITASARLTRASDLAEALETIERGPTLAATAPDDGPAARPRTTARSCSSAASSTS